MASLLLRKIYENSADLLREASELIAGGADINGVTEYKESPLRVASRNGRFDVVRALLDAGGDPAQLVWTPLMFKVVFGAVAEVQEELLRHGGLDQLDWWQRTPFLLAVLRGDTAMAAFLLASGSDRAARGRGGKTALQYAVQRNDVAMLNWLLEQGYAIDEADDFGNTALIEAAEDGFAESVRLLLERGALLRQTNSIEQRAIRYASTLEVVEVLLEHGEDINAMNEEMHGQFLGVAHNTDPVATATEYANGKHRVFGRKNADEIAQPFWQAMIRAGAGAWRARKAFDDESAAEPVWCFERFGRSTTRLDDGRIIVVAGEHEDFYDPDFCIYNDVTVFEPTGAIRIFSYPEDVFPPTDFHSATLVGDSLYLIGSLGYPRHRRAGVTPVYRLDTRTYRIEAVITTGDMPGWISGHRAWLDNGAILIDGGKKIVDADGAQDYVEQPGRWRLDLASRVWQRVEDADS